MQITTNGIIDQPDGEIVIMRLPQPLADILDDAARRTGTQRAVLIHEALVDYCGQLLRLGRMAQIPYDPGPATGMWDLDRPRAARAGGL